MHGAITVPFGFIMLLFAETINTYFKYKINNKHFYAQIGQLLVEVKTMCIKKILVKTFQILMVHIIIIISVTI